MKPGTSATVTSGSSHGTKRPGSIMSDMYGSSVPPKKTASATADLDLPMPPVPRAKSSNIAGFWAPDAKKPSSNKPSSANRNDYKL